MMKSLAVFTLVLIGTLSTGLLDRSGGSVSEAVGLPSASPPLCVQAGGGGAIADYYKIVRAQYVNLAGNSGTFNTTVFITNNRVQPITLKEVYVLGPGGTSTILATYTGLVSVSVPALGQVRLAINSAAIAGLVQETSVDGNGVKSVVVGWHGPPDGLDLTSVIERNDSGNSYSRAMASAVGVPLTL